MHISVSRKLTRRLPFELFKRVEVAVCVLPTEFRDPCLDACPAASEQHAYTGTFNSITFTEQVQHHVTRR